MMLTSFNGICQEKIGISESELAKQIKEITKGKAIKSLRPEFSDIRVILVDDLFKNFMNKLEQYNYDEERKKQLRDLAIRAMMEAKACN